MVTQRASARHRTPGTTKPTRRKLLMPGWLKLLLFLGALVVVGGGYLYLFNPQLGRELLEGTPLATASAVTTAYKWRDASGHWQLTGTPPPAGTDFEWLETRSADNIVPAFAAKKN
jgi:hypothetical protein